MNGGIYRIVNTITGDSYIGQTSYLKHRWIDHRCRLKSGKHYSKAMQVHWDFFGCNAFVFEVLEEFVCTMTQAEIVQREEIWISKLKPTYNAIPAQNLK